MTDPAPALAPRPVSAVSAVSAGWAGELLARQIAGTGGPVGVSVDGQAVAVDPVTRRAVAGSYPAFRWGLAPAGLATRRQLRACGLRPGGRGPVARIAWTRYGRPRFADLYAVATAAPKRAASPAQLVALDRAMTARRTCPDCQTDAGYVIPATLGRCLNCHDHHENQTPTTRYLAARAA